MDFNKPRETGMNDLGSQPREVWKQPGRLPAKGRIGSSENTSNCLFFVACFALFAYVPLVWHSEPGILILILIFVERRVYMARIKLCPEDLQHTIILVLAGVLGLDIKGNESFRKLK
jgi:hypothetical protein